jgi:hypothetical protein
MNFLGHGAGAGEPGISFAAFSGTRGLHILYKIHSLLETIHCERPVIGPQAIVDAACSGDAQ